MLRKSWRPYLPGVARNTSSQPRGKICKKNRIWHLLCFEFDLFSQCVWVTDGAMLILKKNTIFLSIPEGSCKSVMAALKLIHKFCVGRTGWSWPFLLYIKHPFLSALLPKNSKVKLVWVPDELGSQIVLRIDSKYQILRIFWHIGVSNSLACYISDQVTPKYMSDFPSKDYENLVFWTSSENCLAS